MRNTVDLFCYLGRDDNDSILAMQIEQAKKMS